MILFNVTDKYSKLIWVIALQFCAQQALSLESNSDPDDDVEVFSSQEITSIINLPDQAFLLKIESIYVKTKIRFRYARTRITSKIVNPDEKRAQNVSYTLRIPNEAFISRFEMRIDNDPKVYRATVVTAEDARRMLQFAVIEGRDVTLGFVEHSELDFNDVLLKFILGANKKVIFSLIYEERIPRIDNRYESVVYLVPNYMINKTHFRVEVIIEENLRLTSIQVPLDEEYCKLSDRSTYQRQLLRFHFNEFIANHNATITRSSDITKVSWSNFNSGEIMWKYPRSEFIVSYSLENEIQTGHVLMRNGYFIHFFTPTNLEPLRKHVIFVLDISDSMTGLKMNQTISAMTEILDELNPNDFFNIVTFSSEAHVWSCLHGQDKDKLFPFPADAKCKDEARHFIESLKAFGSTNMHDALITGLEIAKNLSSLNYSSNQSHKSEPYRRGHHGGYKRDLSRNIPPGVQSIIIFFTDGEATSGIVDKRLILTKVKIMNFNLCVPIFSLAFGQSADFAFLTKLSTRNLAFARKIYEEADPSFQLANFYREISSPVLANLSFKYESQSGRLSSNVGGSSLASSGYSMSFRGQEILTLGRLNDWPGMNETRQRLMNASVSGVASSGIEVFQIPIKDCTKVGSCLDETDFDNSIVEKLFVYLTLKTMMQEIFIAESERYDYDNDDGKLQVQRMKEKVTEMALKHGLITRYTSMVMSTREQETEEISYSEKNLDREVFLGCENPYLPNKIVERDISLIQVLSNQMTLSMRTALDIPMKYIGEMYNLFEVSNASSLLMGNVTMNNVNTTNYRIRNETGL